MPSRVKRGQVLELTPEEVGRGADGGRHALHGPSAQKQGPGRAPPGSGRTRAGQGSAPAGPGSARPVANDGCGARARHAGGLVGAMPMRPPISKAIEPGNSVHGLPTHGNTPVGKFFSKTHGKPHGRPQGQGGPRRGARRPGARRTPLRTSRDGRRAANRGTPKHAGGHGSASPYVMTTLTVPGAVPKVCRERQPQGRRDRVAAADPRGSRVAAMARTGQVAATVPAVRAEARDLVRRVAAMDRKDRAASSGPTGRRAAGQEAGPRQSQSARPQCRRAAGERCAARGAAGGHRRRYRQSPAACAEDRRDAAPRCAARHGSGQRRRRLRQSQATRTETRSECRQRGPARCPARRHRRRHRQSLTAGSGAGHRPPLAGGRGAGARPRPQPYDSRALVRSGLRIPERARRFELVDRVRDVDAFARAELGDRAAKSGSAIACADHVVTGSRPRASLCTPCAPPSNRAMPRSMQNSIAW